MTRVFVTGAGGFVGHHFLEHVLAKTDWTMTVTDSFRHKGKTDRVAQVLKNAPRRARVKVMTHDLCAPFTALQVRDLQREKIDYMVCFASESHVDRSISDPVNFIRNNNEVCLNSLELARKLRPKAVIWISTDEVYGPVEADDLKGHAEWAPILPSNPYSASKAAQEAIAISYWRTYSVPVIIVNCMNMIGERQDTEKFVPLVISKVLKGENVTIHGTPDHIGTRHYLHARNLADALVFLLNREQPPAKFNETWVNPDIDFTGCSVAIPPPATRPDRYNVASPDRIDNLTMAQLIAKHLDKPLRYQLEDFHSTRPGHDPHYGLDSSLLTELGWRMPVPFSETLRRTVRWTAAHPEWLLED